MVASEPKAVLLHYLNTAHDAVLWKLEGLSEYDLRRPLTPTGTNLLGVVKHLAYVELGYFGDVFDRPHGIELGHGDEPNLDMYAQLNESHADIMKLFKHALTHARETIDALDLDTFGHVPWWGDNNPVTLRLIIVHVTTEMHRHLGQIDILREGLDGEIGLRKDATNMPPGDAAYWRDYCEVIESIAMEAAKR